MPLSKTVQHDLANLDPQLRAVARDIIRRLAVEPGLGEHHSHGWLSTIGALRVRFDRADDPRRLLDEHGAARPGSRYQQRRWRVIYKPYTITRGGASIQLIEIVAIGDAHPHPGADTVYRIAQHRLRASRSRT
ncbi:hypothetical protein Q5424_01280 [Conexibacter sp. JD483]|uniref:hypothetical protein n=1 Tax=unclassified Conexibacter TaxID=2627773 RepID=UPI002718F36A|nr:MULTISPECIES: hypothetical protein [unclassified Conexibacter]MDO8185861.1 hypothetical protein [Conexibacter sp. CPCC 205706]MDO8198605.1 hypothetical protein [Conexibacter sp. CPCC 205762]MDR9367691.1 hypothetical protein [Conexibacter sp. JD483]